ncbi:CACN beta subunit associated regulatory protein, partial [Chelydra serpentina]
PADCSRRAFQLGQTMSNDLTAWDNTTENTTTVPGEVNTQDGYVLLLVLLSIFIGGTLVLLSGIMIICRRCCQTDRRHSRASDDPEKTNTTYLDDSQPPQEITIKVDDPDCLSASSYRDVETERFLSSSSSTGRRVSFNEAALFEQSKKTQEKGRRYTLTEGDFHHLKNARLTHLHVPPPALRIITIHECESSENSLAMSPRPPPPKPSLAIFQPQGGTLPQTALTAHAMCPSSALPGDTYNSTVDTSFAEASPSISSSSGESPSFEGAARSGKGTGAGGAGPGEPPPPPAQGTVLQFFTRLRRHASLEGASPYFKIKKWKIESNQRASSLDTRGSPKRRQFQRQRAASESMEQEDRDAHQTGIIQYIARTDDIAFRPMAGPFLPSPSSPPPSLGRLEPAEAGGGSVPEAPGTEQQTIYHDIWSLRASLELYASSEQSNDRDSVRSDGAESVCSAGGGVPGFPSSLEEAEGLDERPWARPRQESAEAEPGTRKLLQMDSGYASIEAPSRAGETGAPRTRRPRRSASASPAPGARAPSSRASRGTSARKRRRKRGRRGGRCPTAPWPGLPMGRRSQPGTRCPGGTTASTRRRTPSSTPSSATTRSSTTRPCAPSTAPAPTCARSGSAPSSTATPACATHPPWSGTGPRCAGATASTTRRTAATTAPCPASAAPRRRARPGTAPPCPTPTPRSR